VRTGSGSCGYGSGRLPVAVQPFVLGDDQPGETGGLHHHGEAIFDKLSAVGFDLPKGIFDGIPGNGVHVGDGLIGGFFLFDGLVIDDDLVVKGFVGDLLGRTVGGDTDKFAGAEGGDLAGGQRQVKLLALAGAAVPAVDADGGFVLQDFAEEFGGESGGVSPDLAGDDVAGEVEEGVGLIAAVFFTELGEVLDAEGNGYFVAAGTGQRHVHAAGIKGGKFVVEEMAGNTPFLVDEFDHAGDVQGDDGAENELFLWIGPDTNGFRGMGIIDVQGKIIGGKQVVEMRGGEGGEGHTGAVYLSL
jgi:hypothetical protein